MKRLLLLFCFLCTLIPSARADRDDWVLTMQEYKTLRIIDVEGKAVTDFRLDTKINANRDEIRGFYVEPDGPTIKGNYLVVRPLGGKPIQSISWEDEHGIGHTWVLGGRPLTGLFRSRDEALQRPDLPSLFAKWSGKSGVTATYISSSMLRMMEKMPKVQLNKYVDFSPLIINMDGLYKLEFAPGYSALPLSADIDEVLKAGKYEPLLEKQDEHGSLRLYLMARDNVVTGFALVRIDNHYHSGGQFVCIEGKFPRDRFEKIISEGMK